MTMTNTRPTPLNMPKQRTPLTARPPGEPKDTQPQPTAAASA